MSRVRAEVRVPGLASEAEALWYDTTRWPTFVDGLAHVDRVDPDWPGAGSRVVWTSRPGGRGRVVETSRQHVARAGQTVEVEDATVRGEQTVSFRPEDDGVVVALELDYSIKQRNPLTPVVDLLFIRRPQREALERTLQRFAIELRASRTDP